MKRTILTVVMTLFVVNNLYAFGHISMINGSANSALGDFSSGGNTYVFGSNRDRAVYLQNLIQKGDIVTLAEYFNKYCRTSSGQSYTNIHNTFGYILKYRQIMLQRLRQFSAKVEQDMRSSRQGQWDDVDAFKQCIAGAQKYQNVAHALPYELSLAKALVTCERLYDAQSGTDHKSAVKNNKELMASIATMFEALLDAYKMYRPSFIPTRSKELGRLLQKITIKRSLPIYVALKKNVCRIVRKYRSEKDKSKRRQYASQIKPFISMAKQLSTVWKSQVNGGQEIKGAKTQVVKAMNAMSSYVNSLNASSSQTVSNSGNPFDF